MSGQVEKSSDAKRCPVRPNPVMISSKIEHDVVPVAQVPERREVALRRDHDAGRHQDRLGDQRRDRLGALELDHLLDEADVGCGDVGRVDVERRAVRVGRVEMDEPGGERLVRAPARAPAARRERVPGDAVIGAVVREHLVLAWIAGLAVELARHLDRRLDRFRAAAAPLERACTGTAGARGARAASSRLRSLVAIVGAASASRESCLVAASTMRALPCPRLMQNVPESPSMYQRPSTSRTRIPSPSVRISGSSLNACIWVKSIITLPTASMRSREAIVDHSEIVNNPLESPRGR